MNGEAVAAARQALLELIETDRRARIARIGQEAAAQAAAVLAAARGEARARLGEARARERARLQQRLEALEARLATGRRLARQRCLRTQLELAWQALPEALRARWDVPAARTQWVQGTLAAAAAALDSRGWRIVHAPGLAPEERARISSGLGARGIEAPGFVEDATLAAGLAVHAGSNTLDASLRGLLGDRAAVAARLAAALGEPELPP